MKKSLWISLTLLLIGGGAGAYFIFRAKPDVWQEIPVESERFQTSVSESGTVQPENKISITAPISGRIDRVLADEGSKVKRGEIIAWMSSTDRAALLDSAAAQGKKAMAD